MPSPAYIFRDLFTVAELQTMLRDLATTGRISSLGGAAKSSSFENIPYAQLLIELRAELNRLQGHCRAQKVVQLLDRGCDPFPGAYAGGCFVP
jgi:hypothetical protein